MCGRIPDMRASAASHHGVRHAIRIMSREFGQMEMEDIGTVSDMGWQY
jgi:hypothetical protein